MFPKSCSPGATTPATSSRSTSGTSARCAARATSHSARSEEHTSELQSRQYLVCRLLLEKKKTHNDDHEVTQYIHHHSHHLSILTLPPIRSPLHPPPPLLPTGLAHVSVINHDVLLNSCRP